jgi:DNA-binding response OmpR family regulator
MAKVPTHPELSAKRTAVPPTGARRSAGSVRVLVVQGRSEVQAELRAKLRHEGYEVAEAEDRAELRSYFDSLPDLLILDTDFLGQPGAEFLADLRKTYQHVPVILLSDSFGRETLRMAGAVDAAYLFEKPCDADAVVLAALTLVDPGERKGRATSLRWLRWHQGARARSPKDSHQ